MTMMALETLRREAIQVVPGVKVEHEFGGIEAVAEELLQEVIASSEKAYGTNNGSVAWVENGKYYVIPFTLEILGTLKENGFEDKSISVVISGGKTPADPELKKQWEALKLAQQASW